MYPMLCVTICCFVYTRLFIIQNTHNCVVYRLQNISIATVSSYIVILVAAIAICITSNVYGQFTLNFNS